MKEHRISIELSLADIDAIHQVLAILAEKLQPVMVALESENQKIWSQFCEKNGSFVEKPN